VRIFTDRAFAVDNVVLFLLMIPFVPMFFFASVYSQVSLAYSASEAGLYLLTFFAGFATASQVGGRILDARGARPAVVVGCALMAVGFALWARELPDLDFSDQWVFIVLAGAGAGLVLGPANTDAINRAPRTSYGEATGITQTVRNFGSSVGLAVLGSILVLENRSNLESSLSGIGIPTKEADKIADAVTQGGGGSSQFAGETSSRAKEVFGQIQVDYALASRTVFYAMAGAMAVAFVVALVSMPGGKAPEQVDG
jgi:fucose permease